MTNPFTHNALSKAVTVAMLTVGLVSVTQAESDGRHGERHDGRVQLSNRPKTIIIDNLDTSTFGKGNPAIAAMAHEVCGDCHSIDYPTTQPKLSCAGWAKEIVKMGNTFGAQMPWHEDVVTYSMLNTILVYLADNYGQGSANCDMNAVRAVSGLSE